MIMWKITLYLAYVSLLCSVVSSFHLKLNTVTGFVRSLALSAENKEYSIADQKKRHARAVAEGNPRVLNVESYYNPSFVKGKTVLVTGGNRGIGLALTKELQAVGADVIITTRSASGLSGVTEVTDIDVTDNKCGEKLAKALNGKKIDVLINNAGYFYGPVETLSTLNFEEEMKMIDICALGPLRITSGLFNAGLLTEGSRVAIISSQGGSIAWRTTQNPTGHDYGHHMSKAAANMAGVLLAQELKQKKIAVRLLHPGFNKTDMTKKYEHIWEEEGAVDSSVGAKRVIHEITQLTLENTGSFVNCEDGKAIPW
eukprot:gene26468-31988_t